MNIKHPLRLQYSLETGEDCFEDIETDVGVRVVITRRYLAWLENRAAKAVESAPVPTNTARDDTVKPCGAVNCAYNKGGACIKAPCGFKERTASPVA